MAYLEVTIDSSLIDSDLTDFPIGIRISSSDSILSGLGATDYLGFHFTVSSVECYAEIDIWDMSGEEAIIWVKVPTVSSSSDTVIIIENVGDDNSAYVGITGSTPAQNVWDSNFVAVWHLTQDPTGGSGCILDSTSNTMDMTPQGSMTSGDLLNEGFGKAVDFDGSDDAYKSDDDFAVMNILSIEGYLYNFSTGEANNYFDFYKNKVTGQGLNIIVCGKASDDKPTVVTWSGSYYELEAASTRNDQWIYAAVTFDSSDLLSFYINGSLESSRTPPGDIMTYSQPFAIAAFALGDPDITFLRSKFSEVRISNIDRDADWIKATYHVLNEDLLTIDYFPGEQPEVTEILGKISINGKNVNITGIYLLDKGTWVIVEEVYMLNDYAWRQNIKS